jgi:hypothetical protein
LIAIVGLAAVVAFSSPGQQFFAALRIAKPASVNVNIPSFSGASAGRQLQDIVSGILAEKVNVTLDEQERPAASVTAATTLAGFPARLPRSRADAPTLSVIGAHSTEATVNRAQLKTIFTEAGLPKVTPPQSVDGAMVTVRAPRAIRAQYGNCPVPVANTLQNQIQGPPPPSTDNGNCVILIESSIVSADVPPALDTRLLVEIALEIAGMSPDQAQTFQKLFDWKTALSLSMPRGTRSYQTVTVNGTQGMLVNTAGRRGPTYALIWAKNGMVYSLVGYGSSADAVPLASSIN